MISKLLKVFLLLAMLAIVVVNADGDNSTSGDSTNMIDQCIRKNNCADDDRPCRSACAGVPYGGDNVANATHDCYEKCYNTYLASNTSVDVDGYTKCTQDCKSNVYQQGVTEPGSSVPSGGASSGGSSGSSGSGGQDNGSGNSTDNTTGNDNSTQNTTGAASFTTGATSYAYVFTAIFACVVFGVGL